MCFRKISRLLFSVCLTTLLLGFLPEVIFADDKAKNEVKIEAENYTRYDEESIALPLLFSRTSASGGKALVVRRPDIGEVSWVEYDVTLSAGTYQLWIRVGGNTCRATGYLSIDGGKPFLIDDSFKEAIDLYAPVEEYATERVRKLENTFREYLIIKSIKLGKGNHTIRVWNEGKEGYSTSLGFDWIKLVGR